MEVVNNDNIKNTQTLDKQEKLGFYIDLAGHRTRYRRDGDIMKPGA